MAAGYSGKPLAAKLDLKEGHAILLVNAPPKFEETLGQLPAGARASRALRGDVNVVHVFVATRKELEAKVVEVLDRIAPGGHLWVSWPKKSSGVKTDVTEDVLREVILPTGWVDTKVCAVDETWSGLKFLRRKKA